MEGQWRRLHQHAGPSRAMDPQPCPDVYLATQMCATAVCLTLRHLLSKTAHFAPGLPFAVHEACLHDY